jgi:FkbM family methyltransferase
MKTKTKILIAATLSRVVRVLRRITGAGDIAETTRGGLRWRLDLKEGIDFSIYLLGAFEPVTVAACGRLIKSGDIVLDIGAKIGALTLPMARMVGAEGKVYAFEPTQFAFGKLKANLALNPAEDARVVASQIMLTDSAVAVAEPIYSSWPLAGTKDLHEKHLGAAESTAGALAIKLDDFVANANIARIDFIKMDVDGFECHVLGGARETLLKHKPTILMELAPYCLTERHRTVEELLGLLTAAGYRLYHLDGVTPVTDQNGKLLVHIPDGASVNVIGKAR